MDEKPGTKFRMNFQFLIYNEISKHNLQNLNIDL